MTLEQNIKNWVVLDNKIKAINNQLNDLKSEKNKYNNSIIEYIANNNLDNVTINISDGKLKFSNTNYSQPLTYKYIYICLNNYFNDQDKADKIIEYIKSQRTTKTIKEIKRYS